MIYQLSQMGRADEGDEDQRCLVADNISVNLEYDLTSGRWVEGTPAVSGRVTNRHPVEDMPWNQSVVAIGSPKVKQILERAAPGQVQFLPLRLSDGQGNVLPFFVLNLLNVIECHDVKMSKWRMERIHNAEDLRFSRFFLDLARVPDEVAIWRARGLGTTLLAKQAIRVAFEAAGITGAQFYAVDLKEFL